MKLSLIVAMAQNRIIGANGALPWHLPADLKRFKALTMGHPIVMGRKTWESIGRPLPGRTSAVVTHDPHFVAPGALVAHSLDSAIAACGDDDEIFVIGGAELFKAALPLASRLYLTTLHRDFAGDAVMPDFEPERWRLASAERFAVGPDSAYDYTFAVYERN